MITLTSPPQIRNVLGSAMLIDYDKLVITQYTYDVINRTLNGLIRLTSTAAPQATALTGRFKAENLTFNLNIDDSVVVAPITITLTTQQRDAYRALITDGQSTLEQALINIGAVAGVQTAGV